MGLSCDIRLEDTAFNTAADDMERLKVRTEKLKAKLEKMYADLTSALVTPAGEQLKTTAQSVLIEPITKLLLVIEHISATLDEIIGTGYYKDVFIKYEALNKGIQFN